MGAGTALLLLLMMHVPAASPGGDTAASSWNDYAWPTAAGHVVTSTFGEYRASHFHAGIDISSGDMAGYAVYAARAGYVSRIRISPTGYGKILYIRHADGFTTTYAHLEKFAPAIDARAALEQRKLGRYPVDISCTSTEFPVNKGDLVALTGRTGAASPHLHFEIRDAGGNPVNPFLAPGLRIRDDIAPTITRIAVSPIGPESTVDGTDAPRIFRAERVRGTTMRIGRPIVVTGKAGFSMESRDRIPGSRFRNGVYTRTLFVDGRIVYEVRIDTTPWDEAHEIELCYEHGMPGTGRGRFARLYIDSPNHLPFYTPRSDRAGIIDCSAITQGEHPFRIVSADFSGNSAEVSGTLIVSRLPGGSAELSGGELAVRLFEPGDVASITIGSAGAASNPGGRTWNAPPGGFPGTLVLPAPGSAPLTVTLVNRWGTRHLLAPLSGNAPGGFPGSIHVRCEAEEEFVRVRVESGGMLPSPPVVTVVEGKESSTVVMSAAGPEEYTGWFRPRESYRGARIVRAEAVSGARRTADSASLDIEPVVPGTTGMIAADGGNLLIRYDSLSVLKTLFLRIAKSDGDEGPEYELEPDGAVLGTGLTVTIRSAGSHQGLFFRRSGSWQFIGSAPGGDASSCTGRISGRLGSVTLLADSTPPSFTRFTVAPRAHPGPEIVVRFRDDLAGVEYDGLKMYIDGNMVIPEIDGRRHSAVYLATGPLGRGPHQLTMHLTDRIGNSSTTERRFVLP